MPRTPQRSIMHVYGEGKLAEAASHTVVFAAADVPGTLTIDAADVFERLRTEYEKAKRT